MKQPSFWVTAAVLVGAVILPVTAACAPAPTNAPSQQPPSSAAATFTIALPTAAPRATTPTAARTVVPPTAAPSPGVITPTPAPTLAPNPLNVKVKLDDKSAASAVIAAATGGTVSAKAADGTKFTLTIPKNALLDDVKITLTPVTGVDGLPFSGGLVGAVQMAPEGLRFFQPAILTIESPAPVSTTGFQTVAFAYHAGGEGFYLNTSDAKTNSLTVEVWHFSGTGAAKGTDAEVQAAERRVPANAEDAFRQRVREYLGRERQAQLLNGSGDPNFDKKMNGFMREAYTSFIAPQLPRALTDCEAAKSILSQAIGWVRQVELMGSSDEFAPEIAKIWQTFDDALVNCYNKAYDKCVAETDLSQIAVMMGFLRQATLLSPSAGGGLVSRLDQSKIEKCGTFELKFNSTIDGNFPQAGGGVMVFAFSVRSSVPVKLKAGSPSLGGSAPLEYISFSVSGVPCLKAAAPRGGLFKVSDLDPSGFFDPAKKGKVDIRLTIDPGVTEETYASTCPDVPFSLTDSLYTKFFEQLHAKEKAASGYLIANWITGGGGAVARKSYQESGVCGVGGTCKENTTLELIHKAK